MAHIVHSLPFFLPFLFPLPDLAVFPLFQLGSADLLTKSLRLQLLTLQQMLGCSELGGHEAVLGLLCLQGCFQAAACHFLLLALLPVFQPSYSFFR